MVYLLVLIISAVGIALLFMIRGLLRSRNVRRIVRAIRSGCLSFHERHVKALPDRTPGKTQRLPRSSAVELQQARMLLRQAEKALMRKNAGVAERTLIRALTLQPGAKDIKACLACLYLDTSRAPKAEVLYRELLLEHEEPSLYANVGLACYKQGKFQEACDAYASALRLEPRNPHRLSDLGRSLMAARRFEEAAHLLKQVLERLPMDIELMHLLAQCFLQIQELERAEEMYRRINRLEPGNEEVKEKIAALARGLAHPA